MGTCNEQSQLATLADLFSISIDLHPVLQAYNLGVRGGLVLLIEKQKHMDWLMKHLTENGTNVVNLPKLMEVKKNSTGIFFHPYTFYDKTENLFQFLDSPSRAIPTVVVHNAIPLCLQNHPNLLPLAEMKELGSKAMITLDVKDFEDYAHDNAHWLCEQIRAFVTSRFYIENNSDVPFIVSLMVAAFLYCQFYRLNNSEIATDNLSQQLFEIIRNFKNAYDRYSCETDVTFAVQKTFRDYIFNHSEIVVANIEDITGSIYESIMDDKAVLYDDYFYYVPEDLFRDACTPLLSSLSFLNIKRVLHNDGVILINSNETKGYTIKKTIYSMYGINIRPRFLKIRREFLTSVSEPNLEERGECYDVCRRFC